MLVVFTQYDFVIGPAKDFKKSQLFARLTVELVKLLLSIAHFSWSF